MQPIILRPCKENDLRASSLEAWRLALANLRAELWARSLEA